MWPIGAEGVDIKGGCSAYGCNIRALGQGRLIRLSGAAKFFFYKGQEFVVGARESVVIDVLSHNPAVIDWTV